MMGVSAQSSASVSLLKGAILLYGGRTSHDSVCDVFDYATVHEVAVIRERPEVTPGRLMTEKDLGLIYAQLALKQAVRKPVRWIEDTRLAEGADRLVWWTPPGHRSMFFKKSSTSKASFDGHAICPVPALVWMTIDAQHLHLYAVKCAGRPTPETQLFQAPFFNVWGSGQVCLGNASTPTAERAFEPKAWEDMFFGSSFTHPNFSQKDRLVKGLDPAAFWKSQVEKPTRRFPTSRLAAVRLTVGDLIEVNTRDRLAGLERPEGEF